MLMQHVLPFIAEQSGTALLAPCTPVASSDANLFSLTLQLHYQQQRRSPSAWRSCGGGGSAA